MCYDIYAHCTNNMKPLYIYWTHTATSSSSDIIFWLQSTLNTTVEVEWGNDVSLILLPNGSTELAAQLISLNDVIIQDFPGAVCLYITPLIDSFFEHIAISHSSPGIHDLGRIIMQKVQDNELSKSLVLSSFQEFTKDQKDTIVAYMWAGFNASLAARILYLHRNSFTYRLNQFISNTGWEVRYAHVVQFVIWLLYL